MADEIDGSGGTSNTDAGLQTVAIASEDDEYGEMEEDIEERAARRGRRRRDDEDDDENNNQSEQTQFSTVSATKSQSKANKRQKSGNGVKIQGLPAGFGSNLVRMAAKFQKSLAKNPAMLSELDPALKTEFLQGFEAVGAMAAMVREGTGKRPGLTEEPSHEMEVDETEELQSHHTDNTQTSNDEDPLRVADLASHFVGSSPVGSKPPPGYTPIPKKKRKVPAREVLPHEMFGGPARVATVNLDPLHASIRSDQLRSHVNAFIVPPAQPTLDKLVLPTVYTFFDQLLRYRVAVPNCSIWTMMPEDVRSRIRQFSRVYNWVGVEAKEQGITTDETEIEALRSSTSWGQWDDETVRKHLVRSLQLANLAGKSSLVSLRSALYQHKLRWTGENMEAPLTLSTKVEKVMSELGGA